MPSRDEDCVTEVARCTKQPLDADQLIGNAILQEVKSVGRAVRTRTGAEVQKCVRMLYGENGQENHEEIRARTGTLESLIQTKCLDCRRVWLPRRFLRS